MHQNGSVDATRSMRFRLLKLILLTTNFRGQSLHKCKVDLVWYRPPLFCYENSSKHKNSVIYTREQERFFQNKVNFSHCKMAILWLYCYFFWSFKYNFLEVFKSWPFCHQGFDCVQLRDFYVMVILSSDFWLRLTKRRASFLFLRLFVISVTQKTLFRAKSNDKTLTSFSICTSPGYHSRPKRNWKQCFYNILGANKVHFGRFARSECVEC